MSSNRNPNRFLLFDAAALQAARAARGLGPYSSRPGTRAPSDPAVPRCERCDKPRELAEGTAWCEHCLAIVRRAEARAARSKERQSVVRRTTGFVKRRCVVCAGAMRCLPENTEPCHQWCKKFLPNVNREAAA